MLAPINFHPLKLRLEYTTRALSIQLYKLSSDLFVTYTIIQSIMKEWNVFSAFTHLEQWAADIAAPGVRCLAQGSHLSRGHFLPEPGFKPQPWVTSGFKSNALSIKPRLPCQLSTLLFQWGILLLQCIMQSTEFYRGPTTACGSVGEYFIWFMSSFNGKNTEALEHL